MHVLTALGAALGIWAIILTYDGYFQWALWVMAGSVFIDAVDGTLARSLNVSEVVPSIDGARMDNIIDFVTWTVAPLFWAYAALHIPAWVLMVCAFSSIFGFSHTRAKTTDNFFLGFPSYWNIVVFYLFLLNLPIPFSSGVLLLFAVGTFLPVKFVYPTKTARLKPLTITFGIIFSLQLLLLIYFFEDAPSLLIYSSFLYPVYYFGVSFYLNLKPV